MQKIKNNLLLRLVLLALVAYGIHKLVFYLVFPGTANRFIYSMEQLYLVFGITALCICIVLLLVRKKEINNVGFTFLLLTFAKMGVASYFIQPVLHTNAAHEAVEKYSFFSIFVVFLAIETLITIRILNKK